MSDGKKAWFDEQELERNERLLKMYAKASPYMICELMDRVIKALKILQADDSVSRKVGRHLDKIEEAVNKFTDGL